MHNISDYIPPFPKDSLEVQRWTVTRQVRNILGSDWSGDLSDYIQYLFSEQRIASLGPPKPLSNLLKYFYTEVSVLYDEEPAWSNSEASEAQLALIRDTLHEAQLWQLAQQHQLYVLGMRESLYYVDYVDGRLRYNLVTPDVVVCKPHRLDHTRIVEVRHVKRFMIGEKCEWLWDVWSIADEAAPYHRVEDLDSKDVSALVGVEAAQGAAYPYWLDGRPILPYVLYHARPTGYVWDYREGQELVEATLRIAAMEMYLLNCIQDAAFPQRWLANALIQGVKITSDGKNMNRATLESDPKVILMFQADGDKPVQAGQWEPAADPEMLRKAISEFKNELIRQFGLGDHEVQQSSQPSSGAALTITRDAKRRLSRRFIPQFERGDLELLTASAVVWNAYNEAKWPETGWSIRYHSLPLSPDEELQQRARDEEDLRLGFISEIDMFMRRNPGLSQEQAIDKLRQVVEARRAYRAINTM